MREYRRRFGFSADQLGKTTGAVNGAQLDREFDEVGLSLREQGGLLGGVLGADGRLKPATVRVENLRSDVLALVGSAGFRVRGVWASGVAYVVGDLVDEGGVARLCVVGHTAGLTFAGDVALGRWVPLATATAGEVVLSPVVGMVATDVQGAVEELKGSLSAPVNVLANGTFGVRWFGDTTGVFTGQRTLFERWVELTQGTSATVTYQAHPVGTVIAGDQPAGSHVVSVASVAGEFSYALTAGLVRGVRRLAARRVCVAFTAWADSVRPMSVELAQVFGSGGSAPVYGIGSQKLLLGTSPARYRVVVDVPAVTGKTVAAVGDRTDVNFWWDSGSGFSFRNGALGQQSGVFGLSNVKVFVGDVGTPEPPAWDYAADLDEALLFRERGSYEHYREGATTNALEYQSVPFMRPKLAVPAMTLSNIIHDSPAAGAWLGATGYLTHWTWQYRSVTGVAYRKAQFDWLADVGF